MLFGSRCTRPFATPEVTVQHGQCLRTVGSTIKCLVRHSRNSGLNAYILDILASEDRRDQFVLNCYVLLRG